MADKKPDDRTGDVGLPRPVLEGLGRELRRIHQHDAPKPAYLGDRALPPDLEHRLVELESAVEIREKGVDAVGKALGVDPEEPAAEPPAEKEPPPPDTDPTER